MAMSLMELETLFSFLSRLVNTFLVLCCCTLSIFMTSWRLEVPVDLCEAMKPSWNSVWRESRPEAISAWIVWMVVVVGDVMPSVGLDVGNGEGESYRGPKPQTG